MSGSKRFTEIALKLGIAVPASLLLMTGSQAKIVDHPETSPTLEALRGNAVADKLIGYTRDGVRIASAANCKGIHGDQHVDKDDPNITNNGKHSNVHSNQHGDSCR